MSRKRAQKEYKDFSMDMKQLKALTDRANKEARREIKSLEDRVLTFQLQIRINDMELFEALLKEKELSIGDKLKHKIRNEVGVLIDIDIDGKFLKINKIKKDSTASLISAGWFVSFYDLERDEIVKWER